MPFPKNVRDATNVADELRGTPLAEHKDEKLMLRSYSVKTSQAYGDLTTMECETEDGVKIKLYTFSQVVADQCRDMDGKLPLIIMPRSVNNYMVIY